VSTGLAPIRSVSAPTTPPGHATYHL